MVVVGRCGVVAYACKTRMLTALLISCLLQASTPLKRVQQEVSSVWGASKAAEFFAVWGASSLDVQAMPSQGLRCTSRWFFKPYPQGLHQVLRAPSAWPQSHMWPRGVSEGWVFSIQPVALVHLFEKAASVLWPLPMSVWNMHVRASESAYGVRWPEDLGSEKTVFVHMYVFASQWVARMDVHNAQAVGFMMRMLQDMDGVVDGVEVKQQRVSGAVCVRVKAQGVHAGVCVKKNHVWAGPSWPLLLKTLRGPLLAQTWFKQPAPVRVVAMGVWDAPSHSFDGCAHAGKRKVLVEPVPKGYHATTEPYFRR